MEQKTKEVLMFFTICSLSGFVVVNYLFDIAIEQEDRANDILWFKHLENKTDITRSALNNNTIADTKWIKYYNDRLSNVEDLVYAWYEENGYR